MGATHGATRPGPPAFLGSTMGAQPANQRLRIRIIQAGGLAAAAVVLVAQPALAGDAHEIVEMLGVGCVLACIAGRMWTILYVGAKKNAELVTGGPYSMTRNPLYFFSTVGAVGVGLMHGSLFVAAALGLFAYLVLAATARREAAYLEAVFGPAYTAYARRTPMFWPDPSRYCSPAEVAFSPPALKRTFLDGLLFLAAFPLIEAIEQLQHAGLLPTLVSLF
jgi:protein-S-isoprenylcysteine O-methyltransferase Ste14